MEQEDAQRVRGWTLRQRFCLNYYRCLTVPPADCRRICICEDDVIFQEGFIEKMLAAVNEMQQTHRLTKYMLDLYLPDALRCIVSRPLCKKKLAE